VEELFCFCGVAPVSAVIELVAPDRARLQVLRCGLCGNWNEVPKRALAASSPRSRTSLASSHAISVFTTETPNPSSGAKSTQPMGSAIAVPIQLVRSTSWAFVRSSPSRDF